MKTLIKRRKVFKTLIFTVFCLVSTIGCEYNVSSKRSNRFYNNNNVIKKADKSTNTQEIGIGYKDSSLSIIQKTDDSYSTNDFVEFDNMVQSLPENSNYSDETSTRANTTNIVFE